MNSRAPLVLVVDDDPLVRTTLAMLIRRGGFRVEEAADGAAAERFCQSGTPDVALVDLDLPDLTGLELIRRLRALSGLPCVLLTGTDDPALGAQARAVGAADVLHKPMDMSRLSSALEEALRNHRKSE